MVICRDTTSYCGQFRYEEENIHEALRKYDAIEMLMLILQSSLPEEGYAYEHSFSINDGLFINDLLIYKEKDGSQGEDNTSDTLRHEVEESLN